MTSSTEVGTAVTPRPAGRVNQVLSVIAIALGAISLILAAVVPGPAGPTGDAGPTGPVGAGSLLATGSDTNVQFITYVCTAYASVTIDVPGPGTVVVSASVRFNVTHTAGTEDEIRVAVDLVPGKCANDAYLSWFSVGPGSPSTVFNDTLFVQKPLRVLTASNYTYYASGYIFPGEPGSWFIGASLVAVFYPA